MLLEELKAFMPENTSADDLKKNLDIINADAQKMVDSEVKGLKENKTKLLDQMAGLKKNQTPDGFDPDAFAEYTKNKDKLAAQQKELDDKALEGKGQWDALKIQLNETHATALTAISTEKDTTIASLQNALDKELITNAAMKAIESEEGNSLFLLPHMQGNMKTVQNEAGDFEVQILDGEGKQRFGDDATTPFAVKDLVAEMKANDKFAPAFPKLDAGSGSGANAGGKGGGGVNPWKTETRNVTAQAAMNRDNPTLAAAMRKSAGVK